LDTDQRLFYCKDCDYQFSVTSGTVFNYSHLPLGKWFLTTHLLCEAKKGMSACQIQRTVGMSYKTAWYLCHRIRHAMAQTDKPMLDGKVEMDVTYVGGWNRGKGRVCRMDNKEVVVGIRKRNGDLRFFHARDAKGGTLAQYIRENISEDVEVIFTDDASANDAAMRKAKRTNHKKINHSSGVYVMGDIHTNAVESAFSLLKRGIMGRRHHTSALVSVLVVTWCPSISRMNFTNSLSLPTPPTDALASRTTNAFKTNASLPFNPSPYKRPRK